MARVFGYSERGRQNTNNFPRGRYNIDAVCHLLYISLPVFWEKRSILIIIITISKKNYDDKDNHANGLVRLSKHY
jgi:hypothetical protein